MLSGGDVSVAYGINAAGTIVGSSQSENNAFAVRWVPDGKITVLDRPPGNAEARAIAINLQGTMAGDTGTHHGDRRAARWSKQGGITDLGTLPGHVSSSAYAINDHGVIAGFSFDTRHNPHATRWEEP